MKNRKLLAPLFAVMCMVVMAAKCSEFERETWKTLRASDSAIETLTTKWEGWRDEEPRRFSGQELEAIRKGLASGNEWLSAAEASFSAYWETKKLVAMEKATTDDLNRSRASLVAAVANTQKAVAEVTALISSITRKHPAPAGGSVELAAVDFAFLMILFGELATSLLSGKKAAIVDAGTDLVAAVIETVKEAAGEDIDLALPVLRERIANRRRRLSVPVAVERRVERFSD